MNDKKFLEIRDKITPEFLATLNEVARCYGWSGDYIEICAFINDIHSGLGLPIPDLTEYADELELEEII